jgi:hypothetical protein
VATDHLREIEERLARLREHLETLDTDPEAGLRAPALLDQAAAELGDIRRCLEAELGELRPDDLLARPRAHTKRLLNA